MQTLTENKNSNNSSIVIVVVIINFPTKLKDHNKANKNNNTTHLNENIKYRDKK